MRNTREHEAELNFKPLRFDELVRWALENGIEISFRSDPYSLRQKYGRNGQDLYIVTFRSEIHHICRAYEWRAVSIDLLLAECQQQLEKIFVDLRLVPVRPR